jgi:hypothetical protein
VAGAEQAPQEGEHWFVSTPWGWRDLAAILLWTGAVVWLFWEAVSLHGALFYFDIT